jgi:hypothetical protein
LPAVDTDGDRPGVNPGALDLGKLPGESHEAWGARLERIASGAAENPGESLVVEIEREDGSPLSDRPTPPASGTVRSLDDTLTSARRIAGAAPRKAHTDDRDALTPTEPEGLNPRVVRRWGQKLDTARGVGHDVAHCGRQACARQPSAAAECDCRCAPCARRAALLTDAIREVKGDPFPPIGCVGVLFMVAAGRVLVSCTGPVYGQIATREFLIVPGPPEAPRDAGPVCSVCPPQSCAP